MWGLTLLKSGQDVTQIPKLHDAAPAIKPRPVTRISWPFVTSQPKIRCSSVLHSTFAPHAIVRTPPAACEAQTLASCRAALHMCRRCCCALVALREARRLQQVLVDSVHSWKAQTFVVRVAQQSDGGGSDGATVTPVCSRVQCPGTNHAERQRWAGRRPRPAAAGPHACWHSGEGLADCKGCLVRAHAVWDNGASRCRWCGRGWLLCARLLFPQPIGCASTAAHASHMTLETPDLFAWHAMGRTHLVSHVQAAYSAGSTPSQLVQQLYPAWAAAGPAFVTLASLDDLLGRAR